jgi:hypothetical protein
LGQALGILGFVGKPLMSCLEVISSFLDLRHDRYWILRSFCVSGSLIKLQKLIMKGKISWVMSSQSGQ